MGACLTAPDQASPATSGHLSLKQLPPPSLAWQVTELAKLAPATLELLNESLPANWSHGNPVDIIGDASPVRFRTAVKACLDDPNVDGVLVIFTPQAGTDHHTTAELMVEIGRAHV